MRSGASIPAWALVASLVALTCPAPAVIKVDMPVSKMYETAKAVVIGTVARVNAEKGVIDVKVARTVKGDLADEQFRVQIVAPPELIKDVAAEQPVALFVGKARGGAAGILHLADTWLLAERVANANPPLWRIAGLHDAKQAFPGRTPALVRILEELKAGKGTLLNQIDQFYLGGRVRELAKLNVSKPDFLLVADVNGDKKPDLLIGTAGGTRLFLRTAGGYEDLTEAWGAWGAAGGYRAFGDVNGDGKIDLLLNDTLWINDGRKFTAAKARFELPDKVRPLTAALIDVTGDGKPDAVILSAGGELRVFANPGAADAPWPAQAGRTLWKETDSPFAAVVGDWGDNGKPHVMVVRESGVTRYALDADGGPPADFTRLTGVPLRQYYSAFRNGLKNVLAAAIDVNGDRRPDLLIVSEGKGLLMVNRGFGAFLVDGDAAVALTSRGKDAPPFQFAPTLRLAAADLRGDGMEDLLVLTEEGRLYEAHSPPAPAAKAGQ